MSIVVSFGRSSLTEEGERRGRKCVWITGGRERERERKRRGAARLADWACSFRQRALCVLLFVV